MQRTFEEGLMCGLFMDCNKKTANDKYKRLSDPVFEYILNNATLNLEIDLTSHYTYKRYYGYLPKTEDSNRELFVNFKSTRYLNTIPYFSSERIDFDYENYSDGRTVICKEGQIARNANGMCIGEYLIEPYECLVWFRNDIPIVADLLTGVHLCSTYSKTYKIYTENIKRNRVKEIVLYPYYAYRNVKCDEIPYLGKYKQSYKIDRGKIKFLSDNSIPTFSVKATWEKADTYCELNNGNYTIEPIVKAGNFKEDSYTIFPTGNGKSPLKKGTALPNPSDKLITDLTIKEYNDCQMELINQIYAENNQKYELVRIKDYILLDELKPDKLPPELRYPK